MKYKVIKKRPGGPDIGVELLKGTRNGDTCYFIKDGTGNSVNIKDITEEYFEEIKETPESMLMGIDPTSDIGDRGCNVYGYFKDGKINITRIEEESKENDCCCDAYGLCKKHGEEIKDTPEYADNGMLVGKKRLKGNMEVVVSRTFKTTYLAERRSEKQTAELKIRKRKAENCSDWKEDWDDMNQIKYCFLYDYKMKKLDWLTTRQDKSNNIYFSEEGVKKAIKEIKDDLIIYLTY